MAPKYTYELSIFCPGGTLHKEMLKGWLTVNGFESFVEGVVDDVDEIHEGYDPEYDGYQNSRSANMVPLILCDYDLTRLEELRAQLDKAMDFELDFKMARMETQTWMEGWKDSFVPLKMGSFYIYPSWIMSDIPAGYLPIEIDPGMAFGTGQHATTQLCLESLSRLHHEASPWSLSSALDVGTGSGILAIACRKLDCVKVDALDVDPASVAAVQENATRNRVAVNAHLGALEHVAEQLDACYDVVLANILLQVIQPLLPRLVERTRPEGFLILSGLLVEQGHTVLQQAATLPVRHYETREKDGWCSLVLQRHAVENT
ncbi:MAG: 50S ribosomal protein L11 methyltransferase [Zetaproteobacteria bacterium]|nr:50S ribosomal protein L11 methyltransferase [Zetaproteobacteria bacterium]